MLMQIAVFTEYSKPLFCEHESTVCVRLEVY